MNPVQFKEFPQSVYAPIESCGLEAELTSAIEAQHAKETRHPSH
jgi:hypothetical protein